MLSYRSITDRISLEKIDLELETRYISYVVKISPVEY